MQGQIVKVIEQLEDNVKMRIVTARSLSPWPGNPYEDYSIRDEAKRFAFGDKVDIEFRKVE